MNTLAKALVLFVPMVTMSAILPSVQGQSLEVPELLKPWESWVTWEDRQRDCFKAYNDPNDPICFWPSSLALTANPQAGRWQYTVTTYSRTWVPLPGSDRAWPMNVSANGDPIAVVPRDGIPSVQLEPGRYEITGEFSWDEIPQQIAIPQQVGLITLEIDGQPVPIPNWDDQGNLWLRRDRNEETEKDMLTAQVYRVLEDGIPLWLRTQIELTVSGKSREEQLGSVLPANWQLATVDSPIPVAVDDQGRMKAQVRAGQWVIRLHAFRSDDAREFAFAPDAQPTTSSELIAFRANPEFRLAQLDGMQAIDASQTTFPNEWRDLPVYQWPTESPFRLTEKVRGMGLQRPGGLRVERRLWLDDDGQQLTYRDRVSGKMQQIWRLDVADGQELGAVRIDGKGQLITANPQTGSPGVEVRQRSLQMEAIGRTENVENWSATGWQADTDALNMTLILPPGWRAFAVLGADRVDGDWITAWSLLDLFLLLIFSLSVFRIWGVIPGLVAFLAFGLAYHEPGAPRLTWLFVLMPVALLQVVPEGLARRWVTRWKYLAVGLLCVNLIPFVVLQIQSALYPQLERPGVQFTSRSNMFARIGAVYDSTTQYADELYESRSLKTAEQSAGTLAARSRFNESNLLFDPRARIQTGPAEPAWSWNQVNCRWDGPVTSEQRVRPILISRSVHRLVTVLRIALLIALAGILLGFVKWPPTVKGSTVVATIGFGLVTMMPSQTQAAEIPDAEMLQLLRARLLQPADAFPHAADISMVQLDVTGNRVTMDVEIHAALPVAVPLPGRLPVWSPVTVTMDGSPSNLVCRKNDYLWVAVPGGIHRVVVQSMLPNLAEWEWTFLLQPRRVTINAPDWNVSGLRPNNIPEQQIFFVRQQQTSAGVAAYDRKEFNSMVSLARFIEAGLRWQVTNKVTRLSTPGRAISLKLPLLPGEKVLSSNVMVDDELIDVRLGASQDEFTWTSELPIGEPIRLSTQTTDQWVETWHLLASPVWNMSQTGLLPIFQANEQNLIPVWRPWPGEAVSLVFDKPTAVSGETITVKQARHTTAVGSRQKTGQLSLEVESSLGGDFPVGIDEQSEISSLKIDDQPTPVRRQNRQVIVPVRPGHQKIQLAWRTNTNLDTTVTADPVQLPIDAANVTSTMKIPESRWILWADGPLRGPAIRFWTILIGAALIAILLGSLPNSPLRRYEWVLLAIGLTQVHIVAALVVVTWLFLLARRGQLDPSQISFWRFDLRQIGLVLITLIALSVLIVAVGGGLLGNPEMFITGNNSNRRNLVWFQPRSGTDLPQPSVVSVSVWYYRLLMLVWALWLAAALLRWLKWGWAQYSRGGTWRRRPKIVASEPSIT